MRNLQSSPLVDIAQTSPQLVEIKATDVNKRRLSEFNMNFNIKRAGGRRRRGQGAAKPAPRRRGKPWPASLDQFKNLNTRDPGSWPALPKLAAARRDPRRRSWWPPTSSTGRASSRSSRRGAQQEAKLKAGVRRQEEAGGEPRPACAASCARSRRRSARCSSSCRTSRRWKRCSSTSTRPASAAGCSSSCSSRRRARRVREFYAELPITIKRDRATTTTWARSRATSASCRASSR